MDHVDRLGIERLYYPAARHTLRWGEEVLGRLSTAASWSGLVGERLVGSGAAFVAVISSYGRCPLPAADSVLVETK